MADDVSSAKVDIAFSTAFLTAGDPPWVALQLRSFVPSQGLLAVVPPRPGAYGMIGLECRTLSTAGRLDACEISVAPKGVGYEAVAERVRREMRIEPTQARSLRRRLKFISIQIRASNTDQIAYDGPCWPPSCLPIPMPPPPPPPTVPEPPSSPQL